MFGQKCTNQANIAICRKTMKLDLECVSVGMSLKVASVVLGVAVAVADCVVVVVCMLTICLQRRESHKTDFGYVSELFPHTSNRLSLCRNMH